jgi:hypothetical protein
MSYVASAVVIGKTSHRAFATWALTLIGGVASSNDAGRKKFSNSLEGYALKGG